MMHLMVLSKDVVKILLPVFGEKNTDDVARVHLVSLSFDLIFFAFLKSQVATDLEGRQEQIPSKN